MNAPTPAIPVLYRDPRFLAVAKPAGLLVVPGRGAGASPPTVLEILSERLGLARLWPIHRLDRDTSGVLLLALSAGAHRSANRAFEARRVEKRYVAFCAGTPEPRHGVVDAPLGPDPRRRFRGGMVVRDDGRPSRTRYDVVGQTPWGAVVHAHPETGRTHQVRVHLAHAGAPILQDRRYGRIDPSVPLGRLGLHAAELRIPSLALEVEAELPGDMAGLLL